MDTDRIGILVAAGGAAWEADALRLLGGPGLGVIRRCVDLPDLLAVAAAGLADVAVVGADLPGLDAAAVLDLLRHDVRTVAVDDGGSAAVLARIGVVATVPATQVTSGALADAVRRASVADLVPDPEPEPGAALEPEPGAAAGRVVAVWGPAGAPGRTTVAVGLAAEIAARGHRVVLADLDPYGGTVAQHLGVLDEVSGLLACARLVNGGSFDQRSFAAARRAVGPGLELLSGLPRADRWIEVRDGVVPEVLALAAAVGHVVVDTGFCLEDAEADLGRPGPGRNAMTLDTLATADDVLVVGAADPVGLTRLARGLVELRDAVPGVRPYVVVNRMRDRLGWAEDDIRGMVEGFARPRGIAFLPDDAEAADRALVAGRTLAETGNSVLGRSLAGLTDAVLPAMAPVEVSSRPGRRLGRRLGRRHG